MPNTLSTLLRSKRFCPLFITQFLGASNDNVLKNAMVVLVTYKLLGDSSTAQQIVITLASALFILPFFLFSATAGQLSDKFNKARLIQIIKFVEIILMFIGSIGFYSENKVLLMITLFLMGTHSTFFGPLKYAILPDHLEKEELIAGNALIEAGTYAAILLGTLIGAHFILLENGAFAISCIITLSAVLGWLSSLFVPSTTPREPNLKINWNFLQESQNIIRHIKPNRDVYLSILGISWFWLVGATFLAQFPSFTKIVLHANNEVYELFIIAFSVGIAIGSIICNQLLKTEVNAKYVPLSILFMSLFIFDLYFISNTSAHVTTDTLVGIGKFLKGFTHWRILFDILFISIFSGIYVVPLYALMQYASEPHYRARVIACNNILNSLFMVISAVVCMILLALGMNIAKLFLFLGIANIIVSAYICRILPYVIMQTCVKWLIRTLWKIEVHGIENYKNAGKRTLIIANHTSFIDVIILSAFLPNKITFAINTQWAQRAWMKPILGLVDAFMIDPSNPMATKSLIRVVQKGCRLLIFPEGRITLTGALMKIYEGPGLIADKSQATLLPIRLEGAQYTPFSRLRDKVRVKWFPKITVSILPPVTFEIPEHLTGRKRRQYCSGKLYDLMTNMICESSLTNETLFESLLTARNIHGGRHKIVEDITRKPLNYNQLLARIFLIGKHIEKTSPQENPIGVLLPNTNACIILFFALLAYKRLPAMLNFSAGSHNVLNAIKTAKITHIYTANAFVTTAKLEPMIADLKQAGVTIIYLEDLKTQLHIGKLLTAWIKVFYIDSKLHHFINYLRQKISPTSHQNKISHIDEPAVILFTSGSEGTPKGVVLSHRNLQSNRHQIAAIIDVTSRDVVFNALPLFHAFGLSGGLLLPLMNGVMVFSYPSPLHYRIIPELCYDCTATLMFGTDTFLAGYARYAHPYDFYSIRYVFAGAEKLKPDTRKIWTDKFGIRVLEGYGATEAAPILAVNTPMQNKLGTVGRLLPGIEHYIEKIPGIAEGGNLFVKGPNIMMGYMKLSNPGKIEPLTTGWYETGDVVTIDEEGFVTITDRVKRFAKIGGEMISLSAVEYHLTELWPNYHHAVISLPDPKKGEQLLLITTYTKANKEEIIEYFRKKGLTELYMPKKIEIASEIPLLGSGKVDYVKVKANYTQSV
jgi:acyl-[acyl-carrier-protein]-phospholipid O-acyltransferase / long-chain-fatty-acid--[acyl-carrier-protein] ligase